MVQIPKIPEKEELEYREKELFLSAYEQFQQTSKIWLWVLLGLVIVALPAKMLLESQLGARLVSRIKLPAVNLQPYVPRDLEITKAEIIPVKSGVFSAYLQVVNVNSDIAAREFTYEMSLLDNTGKVIKKVSGISFLTAASSKFIVVPNIPLDSPPANLKTEVKVGNWTKYKPPIDPQLSVLQPGSGIDLLGNTYAEGLIRNPNNYLIRTVDVTVLYFDEQNKNLLAVNSTRINDLAALENRYFRIVWPNKLAPSKNVQVVPEVNPFAANFVLERGESLPVR